MNLSGVVETEILCTQETAPVGQAFTTIPAKNACHKDTAQYPWEPFLLIAVCRPDMALSSRIPHCTQMYGPPPNCKGFEVGEG